MFRSSIYGSLIGMMPGLGSSVACFVAYGEEKRKAKNKDKWGTGVVEGIAAPVIGRMIAILPTQYLYPFIFMTAVAASYSSRASIWDVGFAILFGIIGYTMRRTNFSAAAC